MSNLPLPSHLLEQLSQTEQNPRFHAEGSVLAHTEMVLEKFHELKGEFSLSESEQKVLYWASIVHDLGKIPNTVNVAGRWKAPGHERAGVPLARNILLAQPDISTAERHQILDLVRWHGVPLTWVLDQRPIEEIKALSTCTDLRLLGIFALIDFAGRISEDHAETMAKMRHFQEVIVPKAEYEFGKFAQIQEIYSGWNLRHKNAAWKALGQRNVHLLERLLDAEQIEQPPTFGKKVVLALGPALSGKSRYLDDHHGQNFRVNLADYNIGAHLVDDRYAFGRKMIEFKHFLTIYLNRHRTVVLEGRVTHPILRRRLTDMIRDLGVEIDYLVFESALDELLARNGRREAPLEDTLIKTQFEEMKLVHPWEAHRVDYVAV